MTWTRRKFISVGGSIIAALSTPNILRAAQVEVIEMRSTARGERVWFNPHGLSVASGTTIRFVNRDQLSSHTATCYHPDNYGRVRRIPQAARSWDSGFLLPDEYFEVTLVQPGVYDYYCIPHEMAAMVGRIVVDGRNVSGWEGPSSDSGDLSPDVLASFPDVDDILAQKHIGNS